MALIKASDPSFMTAEHAARRPYGYGWRAKSELMLRNTLETFCRTRWPDARVVHELVMGARTVRADVVAITPNHIAAFEVKGEGDSTTRLLHQVGMYQLCVPEVWMVVPVGHADDAKLIRHLIPSVGLLVGSGTSAKNHYEFDGRDFGLAVEAEPVPREIVPRMMLEIMWADELGAICKRLRVCREKTRPANISELIERCSVAELQREVCTELRARNAIWRADPAVDDETSSRPPLPSAPSEEERQT